MLVATLTATTAVGFAVSAIADAPVVPWEGNDPNAVGTLTFYDAAGNQVTGGRTDEPFGYVVGSSTPTGTLATLFAYRPTSGAAPGSWSGSQLTAAVPFATAPAGAPSGNAVLKGTDDDETIGRFTGAYASDDQKAGYTGVYELRLRTTQAGVPAPAAYDVAEIRVSGSSWSVATAAPTSVATTTTLTTSPSSVVAGQQVTLTATVAPATATGTVQFRDNGVAVGAPVTVANGSASRTVTLSSAGARTLTASYTSTSADFTSSVGTASYIVAQAPSSVRGTWSTTAPVYGRPFSVTARVDANVPATGDVQVREGGRVLAAASLASGAALLAVPGTALPPGGHALTLVYLGSSDVVGSSTSQVVGTAVAPSQASARVKPAKVKKSKRGRLTVRIAAVGVIPTGTITVYDGRKKVSRVSLTAARGGSTVVTLPRLKAGKHSLHAVYSGSGTVAASRTGTVRLTVTK